MTTAMKSSAKKQIQVDKSKKPKQKKEVVEKPVETAAVTESVPVPVEVQDVLPPVDTDSLEKQIEDLRDMISDIVKELNEKLKTFKSVGSVLNKLSSSIKKELKSSKKRKIRKTDSVSSEHGFNAPVKISDELADFLSLEKGSKLRRPEVTSLISKYANEHGLKDESNRAIFKPDAKLEKLLGPAIYPLKKGVDTKGYGIFNLQIYLKKHFLKEQVA
jgi:chromatin remodeling complex protein RSC6